MTSVIGLPKMLPVTTTFALPLTLGTVLLNLNVIQTRIQTNTFFGDSTLAPDGSSGSKGANEAPRVKQPDGHSYDPLLLASRIHANYQENTPLVLLLAACAELSGADRRKLTIALATYAFIRVNHVIGLAKGVLPCRAIGAFGTVGFEAALAGWAAWCVRGYWGF